ncbi:MAG: hypothetical protein ACT4PV_00115 [Planctomycetaceae bacterium]
MSHRILLLALAWAALLPRGRAEGDEIHLVGGARLSGEVVSEDDATVTLRMERGQIVVPRARILRIVREEAREYRAREAQESLKAGRPAAAVRLLERALREEPGDASTRSALLHALRAVAAKAAAEPGDAEARAAVRRILELEPRDAEALATAARLERFDGEAREFLVAAEAALAAGRVPEAFAKLEAWRLRRPAGDPEASAAMARAHLLAGARAARDGALRAALDHFRSAQAHGAREEAAEMLLLLRPVAVLEALAEEDLEVARRLLDGMGAAYPDAAVPAFLEAVILHVAGNVEEAVEAYAEAERLAETSGPVDRGIGYESVRLLATGALRSALSRAPKEGAATWAATFLAPLHRDDSAEHFVVYAPTGSLARDAGRAADEAYAKAARELLGGVPGGGKAELVVHGDRRAYLAADPAPEGSPLHGVVLGREMSAGLTHGARDASGVAVVRIEAYSGQPGLLEDVVPHEAVHVVQRRGLPCFRRGHWLDEGLATLAESETSRTARRRRFAAASAPIPLRELLAATSTPPDRAELFYDEAHSFTEFLGELEGAEAFRLFLARFAVRSFEEAAQEAFGVESVDELERRWRRRIGGQ